MAIVTKTELDEMMALPSSERPSGWAWWMTQEQADAADAAERAEKKAADEYKAARLARIASENAAEGAYITRGAGWCNKCHSYWLWRLPSLLTSTRQSQLAGIQK